MSKILVTGVAGLMGSWVSEYLQDQGHDVFGIDNLSNGYKSNIKVPYAIVDLKDKEKTDAIFAEFKPFAVVACAAWAHEGLSAFCPQLITENNYNITINTLVSSIRHKAKRFIFLSSMSVYGEQKPPFRENMPRRPVDIYGIAKSASEQAIEAMSKVYDIDYVILRPHNIIGVRQNLSDPYRNVAGIFIRRALEGRNLIIYGDGEQKRAFSYMDDVVPYISRSITESKANGQIINIGPIEEFTINHLADKIIELQGGTISKEYLPDRPLEVKNAWCTNDKAIEVFGYKTTVSFDEGLKKMWDWAKHLKETTGIAKPKYLEKLELVSSNTPKTWTEKLQ